MVRVNVGSALYKLGRRLATVGRGGMSERVFHAAICTEKGGRRPESVDIIRA